MEKRLLGNTSVEIAPLVLGANVFGWAIDEKTSFDVLDAFIDHGFNAIDTADVYSAWVAGNKGGESETIIGNWLKSRPGNRDKIVIFTKVGSDLGEPGEKGLSGRWISIEASLKRLGVQRIGPKIDPARRTTMSPTTHPSIRPTRWTMIGRFYASLGRRRQ
jgi:aryl-alcohol dehydrogenase-like predicted oxidoreductase